MEILKKAFKKVRKKLVKIEVSFSRRGTLKEDNFRIKNDKLDLFYFFLFFFLFILILFFKLKVRI